LALSSAKGAARTPESIQEPIAPRSVLRELIKRPLKNIIGRGFTQIHTDKHFVLSSR
jgi:hypothetical protein